MQFASRQEAGNALAHELIREGLKADWVLGLPRGGVVVAAEVAEWLHAPLDVLVVRKIGHPQFREFAVGALAEGGVVVIDDEVLQRSRVNPQALEKVLVEERERLAEYGRKFGRAEARDWRGQTIVLVDDGLATGATTEAAARSARKQGAAAIILAIPVASLSGVARLQPHCDRIVTVLTDPDFEAVGRYYRHFPQTSDDEVIGLLGRPDSRTPS